MKKGQVAGEQCEWRVEGHLGSQALLNIMGIVEDMNHYLEIVEITKLNPMMIIY